MSDEIIEIITPAETIVEVVTVTEIVEVLTTGPQGIPGASAGSGGVANITYAANVTANFATVNTRKITLTGNCVITLDNSLGAALDQQRCVLVVTQDVIGGHAITLVNHRYGSGIVSFSLSTGANKISRIGFIYDEPSGKYDVVAFQGGY